jgi:hypothetical protein
VYKSFSLLFFIFLLISCGSTKKAADNYDSGDIRPMVMSMAEGVANDNFLGTEYVARQPKPSEAFQRREALMQTANADELKKLTEHPNPIVALVAFEGLHRQFDPAVPKIIKRFQERSEIIQFLDGDVERRMPMIEYAYVKIMLYDMPGEINPDKNSEPTVELSEKAQNLIQERIVELRNN